MLEREIETHLVKRTDQLGGECRKVKWIGRRGAPDRIVMLPDRTIWVELKRPGAKASPAQLREHKRMRLKGQTVVVVDSIEGVEELLR